MFEVVLYRPEIPPNTGNVIRLCANTGSTLHLVEPLGFTLDDRRMRRAGLDYHEFASMRVHSEWPACASALAGRRHFVFSTRASRNYADVSFAAGDVFIFGGETAGLPQAMLDQYEPDARLRLPMRPGNRSINLSNSVAVVVYEAWRQLGFDGSA
jgi:tRNA (cytidine/uridine-2'-O-)-methyltransferase